MNEFFPYEFHLNIYKVSRKYYFTYVEDYLKENNIFKKYFFQSVGIYQNAYRTSKLKEFDNNSSIYDKVSVKLDIFDISPEEQMQYERIMSKIFKDLYYLNEEVQIDNGHEIEALYENSKSYLKILLKLFWLLNELSTSRISYEEVKNTYGEDILMLRFYQNMFIEEYELFYYLLMLQYGSMIGEDCEIYIQKILNLLTTYKSFKGYILNYLSYIFYLRGEMLPAIVYLNDSISHMEHDMNYKRLIRSKTNLAIYYDKNGMYDKAYDTLITLLIQNEQSKDQNNRWILLIELGKVYLSKEMYEEAYHTYNESISIREKSREQYLLRLFCTLHNANYEEAKKEFAEIVDFFQNGMHEIYYKIARLMMIKYKQVKEKLFKSDYLFLVSIEQTIRKTTLIVIYEELRKWFEETRNYQIA